jgi:Uma2 family endonuclease
MSTATQEPPVHSLPPRPRVAYRRFPLSRVVGRMTVDEWMAFLEKSKHKYDYIHGEIVQVAGASPEHNLLAMNAAFEIRLALTTTGSNCEVLGSDQRIYVNETLYYFPDLVIVCGEMQVDHRDALRNPAAIIEVLSTATEKDDRTDKFRDYQQIASLRHYILIEQNRAAVTHYQKIEGVWTIAGDYRAMTDHLTLALGETTVRVPLERIYRRVAFPEPTSEETIAREPDIAE